MSVEKAGEGADMGILLVALHFSLVGYHIMSGLVTKPIKWHVRPAKIQISLGIRTDHFVGFVMKRLLCTYKCMPLFIFSSSWCHWKAMFMLVALPTHLLFF